MASTLGAYGLRPVRSLDGRPWSGAIRQIPIASGYNTNIFCGDAVDLTVAGQIELETADAAMNVVGVFMGCSYTDATLGFVQRQYWPANQVASDAVAYVCDDPFALFKVQADATLGQNSVGSNFALAAGSGGSTSTGNSSVVLDADTINTTNTLPIRVVDFWEDDEIDSTYPHMLVMWNTTAAHRYMTILGLAAS
jgi:hypothetical protein